MTFKFTMICRSSTRASLSISSFLLPLRLPWFVVYGMFIFFRVEAALFRAMRRPLRKSAALPLPILSNLSFLEALEGSQRYSSVRIRATDTYICCYIILNRSSIRFDQDASADSSTRDVHGGYRRGKEGGGTRWCNWVG